MAFRFTPPSGPDAGVSGGHAHALYLHGSSPVHRLRPQVKIAALLAFVIAVVATPREAMWAFAGHGLIVAAAAATASVPARVLLRRMLIEVPFLAFAVFLPFVGGGEHVDVLGLSLSVDGLWGAWTILAKGSLGVAASIILGATTPVTDILKGLDRLRVPRVITAIAGFMVRYLDVLAGEMRRMRIAMVSRGYDPRWFWQARAYATSAGALFIRSYERGERVYAAMVSRGYQGHVPVLATTHAGIRQWVSGLGLPALAWALAISSLVVA